MNNWTRRELLTAFLGAPLALTACRSSTMNVALPPGEIVGASDAFGHRIRDFDFNSLNSIGADKRARVKVAIVGAGAAGLSAAWQLKRKGIEDFVLLELEPVAGGTARSGASEVSAYPWGAHYLPVPLKENTQLIELLKEMQLVEGADASGEPVIGEQYLVRDPEERVFYKGRWYEGLYLNAGASADDKAQLEKFNAEINRWTTWRDQQGRRAFTLPVGACSNNAEVTQLDRISFAQWMDERGLNSPRLRWFADYACRDDYGLKLENTSAWAGLFYFCSRVSAAGKESQSLIAFPEGNGRFIRHLQSKSNDKLQTNRLVVALQPRASEGKEFIEVVTLDRDGSDARIYEAQKVIYAAPHFTARYLIRDWQGTNAPAHLAAFTYGAWMVANLHLSDRPKTYGWRDFPPAWDNVIYESPALGYVTATHQQSRERGATVLTYYYP